MLIKQGVIDNFFALQQRERRGVGEKPPRSAKKPYSSWVPALDLREGCDYLRATLALLLGEC
jgi:hypothetical protein